MYYIPVEVKKGSRKIPVGDGISRRQSSTERFKNTSPKCEMVKWVEWELTA
jgi:hypothetical protein